MPCRPDPKVLLGEEAGPHPSPLGETQPLALHMESLNLVAGRDPIGLQGSCL